MARDVYTGKKLLKGNKTNLKKYCDNFPSTMELERRFLGI